MLPQGLGPLTARVLGCTILKNEDVDQTKGGGQQSEVYLVIEQSSQRGRGLGGWLFWRLNLGVFTSSFGELSEAS